MIPVHKGLLSMGKYVVVKFFTDLQDAGFPYKVGDTFPRNGLTVDDARLNELCTSKNRQKRPLIKFVPDPEEAKVGSGEKKGRKSSTPKKEG